ncbi:hypothetical protein Moror_2642 [Moniliophthora roreri MCA 2997]|uniref:Uncharacterized protein n=2 Tax=Moniliophthora roreri TaxID=221103 RepID=V2XG70_MONRO|nr:hypothetical protein Moror_2642 [Moniliophthora roreri MCA 2997]
MALSQQHYQSHPQYQPQGLPQGDKIRYIRYGDMYKIEQIQIDEEDHMQWGYPGDNTRASLDVRRVIVPITIFNERQKSFTAIMYKGSDALKLWEDDFRLISQMRLSETSFQFFGINSAEWNPSLIFHHEPMSSKQLVKEIRQFIPQYPRHLQGQVDCSETRLNSKRDLIRYGPEASSSLSSMGPALRSEPQTPVYVELSPMHPDASYRREVSGGSHFTTQTQNSRFEEVVEDVTPQEATERFSTPYESADRNASPPWWKVPSSAFDISAFPI